MSKRIIILGSARSFGNTRKLAEAVRSLLDADLADLKEMNIGYYDYEHRNQTDDFIRLCEKLVLYDHLFFATPVYWYSMSAQMKTFFDRLGDLQHIRPDLAEQLKGKSVQAIVCGSDAADCEWICKPIEKTACFLGMRYEGHLFGWLKNEEIPPEVQELVQDFVNRQSLV